METVHEDRRDTCREETALDFETDRRLPNGTKFSENNPRFRNVLLHVIHWRHDIGPKVFVVADNWYGVPVVCAQLPSRVVYDKSLCLSFSKIC